PAVGGECQAGDLRHIVGELKATPLQSRSALAQADRRPLLDDRHGPPVGGKDEGRWKTPELLELRWKGPGDKAGGEGAKENLALPVGLVKGENQRAAIGSERLQRWAAIPRAFARQPRDVAQGLAGGGVPNPDPQGFLTLDHGQERFAVRGEGQGLNARLFQP